MKKHIFFIFLLWLTFSPTAVAENSAVIIMYHRFGENNFPSTNIKIEQFEQHISKLKKENYSVLPISKILSNIKKGLPLPSKTIGITIDDGYKSIYTEAWPRLKKAGFPFTVFISTDFIGKSRPNRLTWSEIKEMKNSGVDFGAHTASHAHMTQKTNAFNKGEITRSDQKMLEELGKKSEVFAYPFGEANSRIFDLVRQSGYKYAFGQHSGVVNAFSNNYFLPRFALNERYGDLDRFSVVINALPLPVKDLTPSDPEIRNTNPPNIGFSIAKNLSNLDRLRCYTGSEGRVSTTLLGKNRIEVRMTKPFTSARTRLNCTVKGPGNRWRWFGWMYVLNKISAQQ